MCSPDGCFNVACSHVHPSSIITDDWPDMRPPAGTELTTKTPFERVMGIRSESGL